MSGSNPGYLNAFRPG